MVSEGLVDARDRQRELLIRVLEQGTVRIRTLANELGVHEMTVRRDLDQLAESGQIERIHGGARLKQMAIEEISYQQRSSHRLEAKKKIALTALSLINDGDTVGMDASTTCLALARVLPARQVQAVFTGLDAMEEFSRSGLPFYLAGGSFHPKARSFMGSGAIASLQLVHPDKVFFSSAGFTAEDGFTDPNPQEAEVKRTLLSTGALKVALIDHSKFGKRAFATTCRSENVDVVITDSGLPDLIREKFQTCGVKLIVAGEVT